MNGRLTLALALTLAAPPALAQSIAPLEVIAPDGCVDPASLRAELARAGVDLAPTAPWRGRVVARRVAPSQWLLTVDVTAERATHDARSVDRCDGLPELAALLVRNALPPPRPTPTPARPTPTRVGVHAIAGGVLAFGMLAPVSPGLTVGAGVVVGPWRAELAFAWYAPQGNAGSLTMPRVEATHGALRGCFAPGGDRRAVRLDLCLAGELGAVGDVFGAGDPSRPIASWAWWVAAQAGARVTWRPVPAVGLWADAGLRAMLVNPQPALVTDAPSAGCGAHVCLDPVSSWVQPVVAAGLEVRIR